MSISSPSPRQAQARYSPVHGEKLGTANDDGTVFRTRSAALAQCASDLAELAGAVYQIDPAGRRALSVRELASVFAAFRWGGGLLRAHDISAMEFPYSVAGLTAQHLKMRWPDTHRTGPAPGSGGRSERSPSCSASATGPWYSGHQLLCRTDKHGFSPAKGLHR